MNVKDCTTAEIQVLKEICQVEETVIRKLENKSAKQNCTLKKQELQLTSLHEQLDHTKFSLTACQDKLHVRDIKSSAKYQRVRHKGIKLENKKTSFKQKGEYSG